MDQSFEKSLSDSEINQLSNMDHTPPNPITLRRKRDRSQLDESFNMQFNEFKEEIRQLMTTFCVSQPEELKQVTAALKEVQQTNLNIESSIAYVTAQNGEFK
ncbi:unnamed protein product [Leptidea sinapis]|uniref:Uncharacterized protein n=1 Tax=Leptidea sinapis TaxID=189913 RepID=A0A5E4QV94_9NEOP|nr:unnamed protein product [Leptidea sinapis]